MKNRKPEILLSPEEAINRAARLTSVPIERIRLLYDLRFNQKLAPSEMVKHFDGISKRTIQHMLNQYGWQYTKHEAQQMSAKKKDYGEVMRKAHKTIVESNFSSGKEKDARVLLNALLQERIKGAEVIVGLNNKTALNGLEIDIPVVVITAAGILRFGIEYNADYWHDREHVIKKDVRKTNLMHIAGYQPLSINEYKSATTQHEHGTIEDQVRKIVDFIVNETAKAKMISIK